MAYRIDDRTAVSLLPAPRTTGLGQPGFFTAGDPQTGEGATVVTDTWLNMVQEELVGIVQAAGLSPDKTDNGQLTQAVRGMLGRVVRSRGDNSNSAIATVGVENDNGAIWAVTSGGRFVHPAMDDDLQAESLRAQSAEAALQQSLLSVVRSQGDNNDLQITAIGIDSGNKTLWVRLANGEFLHAPTEGQYATPDDLKTLVRSRDDSSNSAIATVGVENDNGAIWAVTSGGRFVHPAMDGDLQAESLRAQSAEAGLQQSLLNVVRSQGDNNDLQVTAIGIDSGNKTLWVRLANGEFLHAPTEGQYATPDDLKNLVRSRDDSNNSAIATVGVENDNGAIWAVTSGGRFVHPAMDGELQAESLRAQNAEAGLQQSLLSVVRSRADNNNSAIATVGVENDNGAIWAVTSGGRFVHPAMDGDLQAESLRAQNVEAGLQPRGNYVRAVGSAGRKIQCKTVSVVHGDLIKFDEPFSNDDVQVIPFVQDGGNNRFHTVNWFEKDRTGWRISLNAWTGSTFANETNPTLVMYVAYGYQ